MAIVVRNDRATPFIKFSFVSTQIIFFQNPKYNVKILAKIPNKACFDQNVLQ
jgi:hypothetical protein